MKFIQTDNTQWVSKKDTGVYECVETRNISGETHLVKDTVMLSDWINSEGNYNADLISIIESYYVSVDNFHEAYPDENIRNQLIAEMIFEHTTPNDCEYHSVITDMEKYEEIIRQHIGEENFV